jgi:hypothetical protein
MRAIRRALKSAIPLDTRRMMDIEEAKAERDLHGKMPRARRTSIEPERSIQANAPMKSI